MTTTKKQKTVAERVAAESKYQRACAIWLADKLNIGRKGNLVDVDRLYDVDFAMESIEGCPTCGPYEWMGLEYSYNGRRDHFEFDRYGFKPGQFLEECVEILKELEKNASSS